MKRKIAVISLVVMLVAVGVGYAAISDNLDVAGSVSTINYNVRFSTPLITKGTTSIADPQIWLSNDSNSDAGDKLNFSIKKALPGESFHISATIVNDSDVDVQLTAPTTMPEPDKVFEFKDPSFDAVIRAHETGAFSANIVVSSIGADNTQGYVSQTGTIAIPVTFTQK